MAKSLNARLTIAYVLAPVGMVPDQYIDAATLDRLDRQAREWSTEHLDPAGRQSQESQCQGDSGALRRRSRRSNRAAVSHDAL
jgi:hypothetical protein